MNLGQSHTEMLTTFLNSISNNTEFEIRFGKFIYDRYTKKNNFESEVEVDFFYRFKNRLMSFNMKHDTINTIEYIYNTGKGNIKRIVNTETNDEICILKNTFKK